MKGAVDIANYTSIPTPAQLACLRAAGYTRVIVGCSYGVIATMQLAAAAGAGLEVEAYAFVDFTARWEGPLQRALLAISSQPVRRLWLDCEAETHGLTRQQVVGRIAEAEQYVRRHRPDLIIGIYTAGWWWMPQTGDSQSFKHLPLWTAAYVQDAGRVPDPKAVRLYGGWNAAALWQYAGTIDTCGLNTDRNLILESEEDSMKPFLCWSGRVIFVGPAGPRWITDAAVVAELGRIFGGLDANGFPIIGLSGAAVMALGAVP